MHQYNITLIATRHQESGRCTSNALYQIIEQIAPDVIFEEIPSSKFESVYKGLRQDSLETHTIKRYLNKYSTFHVPVDAETDEITDRFIRSDYQVMLNIFGRHSIEYSNLFKQRQLFSEEKGFPYLNSDEWTYLSKSIDTLEEQVIKFLKNDTLTQRYKEWLNLLDIRNNAMIRNIYKYVEINKYENGLFLVGVEHRRQIIDKIKSFEQNHHLRINWNFNYFN
ncbi:MAG: hypothetical protein U0T11_03220 [Chitinophagaceae bacterium]